MKKIFAALVSVALMVTAVAFTSSCAKDIANAESLVGTIWIYQNQLDNYTYELTFTSATEFKITSPKTSQEFTGVFILMGGKSGLTGTSITLTPQASWMGYNAYTPINGKFESEKKLVIDGMIFNRSVK